LGNALIVLVAAVSSEAVAFFAFPLHLLCSVGNVFFFSSTTAATNPVAAIKQLGAHIANYDAKTSRCAYQNKEHK